MFSTYLSEDVTILLKDISGLVTPLDTKEREKRIQAGTHYSEMLPVEYSPTGKYIEIYELALKRYAQITSNAVATVAEQIWRDKGLNTVLVSLARAGTPVGILIKRYIKFKYKIDIPHYTISIIRGKGIDENAIKYLLNRYEAEQLQFVDGWTGKGAILNTLSNAVKNYPRLSAGLAVLSDPANISEKCGTKEDVFIASSCLNCTVSGLLSRTFYRKDIIKPDDFHGVCFYKELEKEDRTYQFINEIESCFPNSIFNYSCRKSIGTGIEEVQKIAYEYSIKDINYIKPSIGEATRVLLRRVPWKILVHSMNDEMNLGHIYQLAREKNVEIEEYPLRNYKACGLIKDLSDI